MTKDIKLPWPVRTLARDGGVGSCQRTHHFMIDHNRGVPPCKCVCHYKANSITDSDTLWYICETHKIVTPGKSRCDVGVTLREMCQLGLFFFEREEAIQFNESIIKG